MLYPVELRAETRTGSQAGRGERIRTSDILLPKQTRYQAALHPENGELYLFGEISVNDKTCRQAPLQSDVGSCGSSGILLISSVCLQRPDFVPIMTVQF